MAAVLTSVQIKRDIHIRLKREADVRGILLRDFIERMLLSGLQKYEPSGLANVKGHSGRRRSQNGLHSGTANL